MSTDDLREIQQRMALLGKRDVTQALEENLNAAAKVLRLLRSGSVERACDGAEMLAQSFRTIAKSLSSD